MHLAPFPAYSASYACIGIDSSVVVGMGHGFLDAPVIDSSEYAAAATAAVADVADPFHHVANSVNQTHFLGLVEKDQRFFL